MPESTDSDTSPSMVFDLSSIDSSSRFEFWHDVGSLIQRPIRTDETSGDALYVRAHLTLQNEVVSGSMTASPQRFERTSRMIRSDHIDNYLLSLVKSGSVLYASGSCEQKAQPGDLILVDHSEASCSQWSAHEQIYVAIPRMLMTQTWKRKAGTQVLRAGTAPAVILGQYLQTFWTLQETQTPEDKLRITKGLICLAQLYFGDLESPVNSDIDQEHHQSMMGVIKGWIHSQLHRQDLGPEEICARFHLSRSSLYAQFQADGGVRAYIQTCRLTKARIILESTDNSVTVGTIARQLGFTSLSSFSRAFADHWGLSPREARKRAHAEEQSPESSASQLQEDSTCKLKETATAYYHTLRNAKHSKQ